MKAYVACFSVILVSVSLLRAGGGALPRREDMPKYVNPLKTSSSKPAEKITAANMIGKRGEVNVKDVEDALEPLKLVAKKDRDNGARKAAIGALGSIAPEDADTVPLLIEILKNDKAADVKRATAEALARFGPRAKSALPTIKAYGATLDKKERRFIQSVTGQIQGISK